MIPAFLMVWLPRLLLGAATALPLQEGPPAAPVVEGEGKYGATPDPFLPYRKSGRAYWRFFDEPTPYRGPGREEPPPQGIDAVKIGLLAPVEKGLDWEIGRSVLRGATLALEEANAAGGFRERLPYELVVRNDSGLWGASSNTLVKLAYEERVWAVLGSVGASTTHVALRVALKAEMPMVTTASTDPTITETAIPWILRCYPDDRQHGYRLARFIFQERGLRRVAMMRSNDKYGRMGVVEFSDAARRVGSPIVVEVRHDRGERDFERQLERIRLAQVDAIVLWSSAADAGHIVAAMRASGLSQPIFGPERLLSSAFLEGAGRAGEGVVVTSPLDTEETAPSWTRFAEAFRASFSEDPDHFAAYSYDGARILLEAVDRAGLNRALIRDELARLQGFNGVSGPMRFDTTHNNLGKIHVVQVKDGRFVRLAGP